jgi:DNA-binding LytR/AlgR family response regulator
MGARANLGTLNLNDANRLDPETIEPGSSGEVPATISNGEPLKRLLIREGDRAFFLPTQSIQRIDAEGDYVRLHVASQSYRIRTTMSGLHKKLPSDQFLRLNRSSIVNVDQIAELQVGDHGDYDVLLRDGTRLKLSRLFRQGLRKVGGVFAAGH